MSWIKRNWPIIGGLVLIALAFSGAWLTNVRAQTPTPYNFSTNIPHTSCPLSPVTVAPNPVTATYCWANDGLWWSVGGGAYTLIASAGGVTSITACNLATPPVCGTAQSGAVVLGIPRIGTEPAQTITVTIPAQNTTLQ
jgi:hypothetical protein